MSKYKFTPMDLANYILCEDLSHTHANGVIFDLFENYNDLILYPFRNDYMKFKSRIFELINLMELDDEDLDETELIMCGIDNKFNEYINECIDEDYFDAYFKRIKLKLMYSLNYKKIKLRKLLKELGYKRRTPELVHRIILIINALGLKTYLAGYEPCNICDINLDDIIIIRLND